MKKIITFTLLSLCLSYLAAQPTITSDIMFAIGDSAPVQYFDQGPNVFDAGPAGANVMWDFSNVNTDPSQAFTWSAELPTNTAWADSFPSATHAFRFPQDSGASYLYYQFDGSQVELLGTINTLDNQSSKDTFIYNFNQNPQLEMWFPTTYLETNRDTAEGTAIVNVAGSSVRLDRTIYRSFLADGYGTITTPFGTFNDVLRVRVEEDVEDRAFGILATRQRNIRYFWYTPSEKYLIHQMDSLVVLPLAGPSSVSFSMFYRTGHLPTGLFERNVPQLTMAIAPNPARDQVSLSLEIATPTEVKASLYDLHGRLIQDFPAVFAGSGTFQQGFMIQDVPTGHYFMKVSTDAGSAVQQLIIR